MGLIWRNATDRSDLKVRRKTASCLAISYSAELVDANCRRAILIQASVASILLHPRGRPGSHLFDEHSEHQPLRYG
ncbi:hypothetical protein [Bradyrhizobium sp. CW10]|uniref:hypothetical protein n=1 Tax=Bradyrhizobium sp. CW10 TaxID=2782683 RepID=UPI001FFBE001|nr:hypothetical protein [Bradyrhizobium sp. CW10]MCK1466934.1 hypothetical protein [Bradyrhizobium sp. CW10]